MSNREERRIQKAIKKCVLYVCLSNSWTCFSRRSTISPKNYRNLVLGADIPIKATELGGCWNCCCFPCGMAIMKLSPESDDDYQECGLFFWLFAIPIPYFKRRKRITQRTFVNTQDESDRAMFKNASTISFPPELIGCGGKI